MQINLTKDRMYKALVERDSTFEGTFVVGVKTTGIFCRPSCRARKPKFENVEFFARAKEALDRGYRPCKVCQPLMLKGEAPDWVKRILHEVSLGGEHRMNDFDIRNRGIDPNRLRRWFKQNHNMTFQAYLRSIRLGNAFGHLADGKSVIDTALENGYQSLSGFTAAFKKQLGTSPTGSKQKSVIYIYQFVTPLGPMMAAAVEEGICLLEFTDRRMLERELVDLCKRLKASFVVSLTSHMRMLKEQLNEYFAGKRKHFSVPLVTPGSDFQNKVWKILQTIPYGETRSYKDQAIAVLNPRAVRAVARVNGQNRIAILIPCHRVIGTNGELVGYAGGIWRKKYLLELESRHQ